LIIQRLWQVLPVLFLVTSCTVMDDKDLPVDQLKLTEISDFEVNLDRDFIRGRIQNNGDHNITSSIFRFELFAEQTGTSGPMTQKVRGDLGLALKEPLLSQNFVVREPLKPGYSTEFYFELKMDFEHPRFLYAYEIIQLKGR